MDKSSKSTPAVQPVKTSAVTPDQIDGLRQNIFKTITNRMEDANKVLLGQKNWSQQQLKLFHLLLNKVVPDLHHTYKETESPSEDANLLKMSRADLERLAQEIADREGKVVNVTPKKRKPNDNDDADEAKGTEE